MSLLIAKIAPVASLMDARLPLGQRMEFYHLAMLSHFQITLVAHKWQNGLAQILLLIMNGLDLVKKLAFHSQLKHLVLLIHQANGLHSQLFLSPMDMKSVRVYCNSLRHFHSLRTMAHLSVHDYYSLILFASVSSHCIVRNQLLL